MSWFPLLGTLCSLGNLLYWCILCVLNGNAIRLMRQLIHVIHEVFWTKPNKTCNGKGCHGFITGVNKVSTVFVTTVSSKGGRFFLQSYVIKSDTPSIA